MPNPNHVTLLLLLATTAASSPAPQTSVVVKTFTFRPDTVVVAAGASVSWRNDDDIEHTVTSDSARVPVERPLNGVLSARGATYRTTLRKPGIYPYFCERHAFMRGVVLVTSVPHSGSTP